MNKLKKHSDLPVYIVEDHCDVLPHIYRNIASKYLPFENNTIVHLDSHPDLLIDKNLKESTLWEKQNLYDSLSIENWILPGCYTGQFSKVFWVKPFWADQISDGQYDISIGKYDDYIRIGSELYYFISDGLFVDKNQLKNCKQFELIVGTRPHKSTSRDIQVNEQYFILDIDLDYFSTKNPFLDLYSKGGLYEALKPLFSLNYDTKKTLDYRELIDISKKHIEHLEVVSNIFKTFDNEPDDVRQVDLPENLKDTINKIFDIVEAHYDVNNFDWLILLNAGMTCDMTSLPHHVSTEVEIADLLLDFELLLEQISHKPTIVTIARSSDDDYCPKQQVEEIQNSVIKILEKKYGKLNIEKNYSSKLS